MIPMPILGLGFLTGMQHALEADHIAAVSSIAARQARIADALKHGLTWGLGHTLALFSFAGVAIVLGWAIPQVLAPPLEAAVGVMLSQVAAQVRNPQMAFIINVNSVKHTIDADDDTPLLWVLRDIIGLTGTKFGCGMALCGACTVHVDGAAVRSCITPIGSVGSSAVTTIEAIGRTDAGKKTPPIPNRWQVTGRSSSGSLIPMPL